jgi:hypothetical protein
MVIQQVVTEDIRLQVQLGKIAFTMASRFHRDKFQDLKIIAKITCWACVKKFNIQSPGSFHAFHN